MTILICTRCNKKFYNATHLEDHMNRKIPCIQISNKNKEIINDNYCEKCDKYFSRPYTLKRHINMIHNKKNKTSNINNARTNKGNINQFINTGDNSIPMKRIYFLFQFYFTRPINLIYHSSDYVFCFFVYFGGLPLPSNILLAIFSIFLEEL
jgi:uncharacterized Zn-finger protein